MNLLAHHLKKDARHVRWLLALWIFLVLSEALLIGFGSRAEPDDSAAQVAYQMITMFLPMLQFLLLVVIVPLLVQDEPLVGTTAFWFTRPIPRKLLLCSKAMFIGVVFVLFPVFVELAVMAANNVPLRDVAAIAPEILFNAVKSLVPIFALAALTLNFARFAITGVALYVGFIVVYMAVYIVSLFLKGPEYMVEQSQTLALSRSIVSGLILLIASSVVVAHQYLTRRTPISVVLAGVGLVAALTSSGWWRLDFMRLPGAPPVAGSVDCSALSIDVDNRFVHVSSHSQRKLKEPEQRVSTNIKINGLPATCDAGISAIRTRFVIEGRDAIVSTNRNSYSFRQDYWSRAKLKELFPDMRVIGASASYSHNEDVVRLPLQRYMEVMNTPGLLEGEVDVVVQRLVAGHAFPLERGSRFREGSTEETIGEVRPLPTGAMIILRCTSLNRQYVRRPEEWNAMIDRQFNRDVFYVLRHRERGEIIMPEQDSNFDFDMFGNSRHLKVKPLYLRFPADNLDDEENIPVIDKEWLAGAELVRITREREGVCTVPLRKDGFLLAEKTRHNSEKSPQPKADTDKTE